MAMAPLYRKGGITLRQLKEFVKDLEETDEHGEDYEVWIQNTDDRRFSNPCESVRQLNKGDIILAIRDDE